MLHTKYRQAKIAEYRIAGRKVYCPRCINCTTLIDNFASTRQVSFSIDKIRKGLFIRK